MRNYIKNGWNLIPKRTRFWIKTSLVVIVFCLIAFGYGTFKPNKWVKTKIINDTENQMVTEWQNFGLHKPSIEYTNNTEFVMSVGRCIDYLNLHLLHRDRVQKYIILPMAVLETGWGKSRFAKEANNLFGIRTWDPNVPQLKPLELPNADFGVKKYLSKCDSVEDMINIINRHSAYEDFRIERATQLESGKIDIDKQIEYLSKWSTNPEYTSLVKMKAKAIKELLEDKLEN